MDFSFCDLGLGEVNGVHGFWVVYSLQLYALSSDKSAVGFYYLLPFYGDGCMDMV